MTRPPASLASAARGLLAATASLPGTTPYGVVQAVTEARKAVVAALDSQAAPRAARAAKVSPWTPTGPEAPGTLWPRPCREWRRDDGAFVRLFRQRAPGWTPTIPEPGSIVARTILAKRPQLAGFYSVWAGPGAYKGFVSFYAGDAADADLPAAAIDKILRRHRTYDGPTAFVLIG